MLKIYIKINNNLKHRLQNVDPAKRLESRPEPAGLGCIITLRGLDCKLWHICIQLKVTPSAVEYGGKSYNWKKCNISQYMKKKILATELST